MKLYGSLTSPFVRKVRAFALERGVPFEMVVEDPWQVSPRLVALNPAGKVPVLERDDGSILVESPLIMEFLDTCGDPAGALIPRQGEARWQALMWHARAHALIEATVARLLELRRPEALRMPERVAREEQRFASVLDTVERELPESPFIGGETVALGDIMLAVALRYAAFRYSHPWQGGHPRLAAHLEALEKRPSIRDTEPPGFL